MRPPTKKLQFFLTIIVSKENTDMSVKTLVKAVAVLDCFTPSEPVWTGTALANRLNMPVTTLHSILHSLVDMDFLVQSPQTKEFRMGFRYLEMGSLYVNNSELNTIVQGVVHSLGFGQEYLVGLNVLYKGWAYNSLTLLPLRNTRAFNFLGPRMPAHLAAGGLAVLAHLPREEVEAYCTKSWEQHIVRLPQRCEELQEQLEEVRKNGYAVGKSLVDFESQRPLGAPIFGRQNEVLGALVLLGAEKPFPPSRIPALGEQLCVAANAVSIQCGHLVRDQRAI